MRTSRREAPHAPPRPACGPSHAVRLCGTRYRMYIRAHTACPAPRAAPRATHSAPGSSQPSYALCPRARQPAAGHARTNRDAHRPLSFHRPRENAILMRAAARQGDLLHHGNAGGAGICDQACGPPTLPAEKPRVGKASAALPRDGREPRRRETGDHLTGRRRPCDCAGGDVVKMPRIAARAVPLVSAARLARCLM